jgi:hypothetical protein
MGRNPLWKDMKWNKKEDTASFGIRIPNELSGKLKEIARLEQTTVSFLLRRQLITLIRKKCRVYNLNLTLPEYVYPGPRHQRPKIIKIQPNPSTCEPIQTDSLILGTLPK